MTMKRCLVAALGLMLAVCLGGRVLAQIEPLPSWNDGAVKKSITDFVARVGDLQMLQWTAAGGGARFMGLVHHTDSAREYAYDRQSHIGKLDKALDEAKKRNWTVIHMKGDWKQIFPPP